MDSSTTIPPWQGRPRPRVLPDKEDNSSRYRPILQFIQNTKTEFHMKKLILFLFLTLVAFVDHTFAQKQKPGYFSERYIGFNHCDIVCFIKEQ